MPPTDQHLLRADLVTRHPGSLERFPALAGAFADRHAEVAEGHRDELVAGEGDERNAPLEPDLLPVPPPDYLRHPAVANSMFVGPRYVEPELPAVLEVL